MTQLRMRAQQCDVMAARYEKFPFNTVVDTEDLGTCVLGILGSRRHPLNVCSAYDYGERTAMLTLAGHKSGWRMTKIVRFLRKLGIGFEGGGLVDVVFYTGDKYATKTTTGLLAAFWRHASCVLREKGL